MAEAEDVSYASVVFKTNQQPQPGAKTNEETVYDEVKVQSEATKQNGDTNAGLLTDKKANRRNHHQCLACFFGILCIILLVAIIAVCVYFTTSGEESEVMQLRENQTTLQAAVQNLSKLNHQLKSDLDNLEREHSNLTVRFDNLTVLFDNLNQSYATLEIQVSNLTAEIQELKTQRDNLTQTIKDMETQQSDLNVSRAQWSIDAYCSKTKEVVSVRHCNSCQSGWTLFQSGCYAINNEKRPEYQKTWDEAQADCRQKISHLAVISNDTEKAFVIKNSFDGLGYWIGLRAEEGKWKWVDGSDLTDDSWIQQPATEGHCAISFHQGGLKSANCTQKNAWVCQKKGLSV